MTGLFDRIARGGVIILDGAMGRNCSVGGCRWTGWRGVRWR